jgi:6-phosphofructokinase
MASNTLSRPPMVKTDIKRVGMLFAGGPAPAANAVISAAAKAFMGNGVEVIGLMNGYSNLVGYKSESPLVEGKHYFVFTPEIIKRKRNAGGIIIGTARANPGKPVRSVDDLGNPEHNYMLKEVYEALCSLELDALISIGGDDTLKSANMIKMYQDVNPGPRKIKVVHLPKTIDNDYSGIDFTFGYFTAVHTIASEIRSLVVDGEASKRYFLAETMGRSAGWLAYGAGIAGEASIMISVEDITGDYATQEEYTSENGETSTRTVMNFNAILDRVVNTMIRREKDGKEYGVIVMAEGLAEYMPYSALEGIERDEHGHLSVADVDLAKFMSKKIMAEFEKRTGHARKITPLQLGYESRCQPPLSFDAILGSQLGVGGFKALVEEGLNGVMASVSGVFDLHFVPFEDLIDTHTLKTVVRFIQVGSDFHRLARFMETYVDE